MDRGPRTGVTEAVSQLDLDICKGVGPKGAGGGPWIAELDDRVATLIRGTSLYNPKLAFTSGNGFRQNTEQFIHDCRTRH